MRAVVYRTVMDDVELEVTDRDARRGFTEMECPACEGTGVCFWHPGYPDDEGPGCVECSTRGTVGVSL